MHEKISVNPSYTLSVNIERDSKQEQQVAEYILTDNSQRLLRTIADTMLKETTTCAWTLIGPYGTGKSAFCLYLSALLSEPASRLAETARRVCEHEADTLAKDFKKLTGKKGFLPVMLAGSREPMAERLMHRLAEALEDCRNAKTLIGTLRSALKDKAGLSETVELVRQAIALVNKQGYQGLILTVDEMGKFLEYDAENAESDNAYLLQSLGELTRKTKDSKGTLLFIGAMHQGFDFYARGLGKEVRNEWVKVQGRFAQLPFVESPEQMLRLVARAITQNLTQKQQAKVRSTISEAASSLHEAGLFGSRTLERDEAISLFARCYPLHPVSAAILVLLCQKIGQSERTLFSYLVSGHPRSFSAEKQQLKGVETIAPWTLLDYLFVANTSSSLDPVLNRHWVEAQVALERLGHSAPPDEMQMLKTIALFNLVGARGQFVASPELLRIVFTNDAKRTRALSALREKSLITYRKFGNEYRIWQGSDFDLDAAIEEAKPVGFRLTDALNEDDALPPIIARKHAIETGNLRATPLLFIDADSPMEEPDEPHWVVYLASGGEKQIPASVQRKFSSRSLLTLEEKSDKLSEIVRERHAFEKVIALPELNGDPIALAEAKTRYMQVVRTERVLLSRLIACSDKRTVFWKGEKHSIRNNREMQTLVSKVMDATFSKAPVVVNELVNRDKPSTQAAQARNRLLMALLDKEDQQDLGIEKYPPEKALYLSLLKETGLHRKKAGVWRLQAPDPATEKDPKNFHPIWQRINDFLEEAWQSPRPLTDLDNELRAAPYGLKRGMLPIFYALVILTEKNTVAVYEDGRYMPFFASHHLERFLVRPETFSFKKIQLEGVNEQTLQAYAEVLAGDRTPLRNVLEISRPLVMQVMELPQYAKQTSCASEPAQKLCSAVTNAKSPYDMLFADIPLALGFSEERLLSAAGRKDFGAALIEVLRELTMLFPELLRAFQSLLAQGLGKEKDLPLPEIRRLLAIRVAGLERYTLDRDGLLSFIKQVTDEQAVDQVWLNQLLLHLSGKSPQKWDDYDRSIAESKLAEYMFRIRDMETLRMMDEQGLRSENHLLVQIVNSAGEEKQVTQRATAECADDMEQVETALQSRSPEERVAILATILEKEMQTTKPAPVNQQVSASEKAS